MYDVRIKKIDIERFIEEKGYSKSEISRRLGKKNVMYVSNALRNLKKMDRLEKLEEEIREVLK